MSRTVPPALIPRICVCTAPATPMVHKSEFEKFIDGSIADGGGDLSVVSDLDVTLLSEVLSVIIVSEAAKESNGTRKNTINKYFIKWSS